MIIITHTHPLTQWCTLPRFSPYIYTYIYISHKIYLYICVCVCMCVCVCVCVQTHKHEHMTLLNVFIVNKRFPSNHNVNNSNLDWNDRTSLNPFLHLHTPTLPGVIFGNCLRISELEVQPNQHVLCLVHLRTNQGVSTKDTFCNFLCFARTIKRVFIAFYYHKDSVDLFYGVLHLSS